MNAGDTAFVLMSAALVMLMTPGLALFYGGMVRNAAAEFASIALVVKYSVQIQQFQSALPVLQFDQPGYQTFPGQQRGMYRLDAALGNHQDILDVVEQ